SRLENFWSRPTTQQNNLPGEFQVGATWKSPGILKRRFQVISRRIGKTYGIQDQVALVPAGNPAGPAIYGPISMRCSNRPPRSPSPIATNHPALLRPIIFALLRPIIFALLRPIIFALLRPIIFALLRPIIFALLRPIISAFLRPIVVRRNSQ